MNASNTITRIATRHETGTMSYKPIVYIVDDDDIALWMLRELLEGIGADFRTFGSAEAFLKSYTPGPCECLISDLRMPEIGGLEIQRQLLDKGASLPIIFVSGYPEVSAAVQAIKQGAFDFLEKPVNGNLLREKVQSALARSRELHAERLERSSREARVALLTPKEREIADQVVLGKSSRQISDELGISVRTVENHRARIMAKLHVESAMDLVKLFM
jgi:two-component system, LuxR family, response regulator FixJ